MSKNIKYDVNNSQGREVNLPCVTCAGKPSHKVMASFDENGTEKEYHRETFHWTVNYQVVQCQGCKSISFRQVSTNSEDHYQIGEDEWEYGESEKLFPSRLAGRKGLGNDTRCLPPNVCRIYDETLSALANQCPVLSGIGLRALLETICKEKNASGGDLLKKIDSLVTTNVLTPASAAILHKIRTLGNAAAHEVKPHSDKQLSLAMDIIEHLLKEAYILPKQVESEFDEE
jgi:hypothetical protein